MIPVTKPFLPPQEEYLKYVKGIWQRNWLTNHGPLVNELELQLKTYLNVPYLLYTGNGTIAIQMAIKALALTGKIITTPFSYVATTSSIVWENNTPTFVDICPDTFNIDAELIEQAITKDTVAILATHVFGNPCAVERIASIADKHQLKVIYDAAHCFGTNYKAQSILNYGDISTLSLHATKLCHSVEGGAVVTSDKALYQKLGLLRNFGHTSPTTFAGVGINAKNSEFHAAMGLCNLTYIDEILKLRKKQYQYYQEKLQTLQVTFQKIMPDTNYNHAYFPIVFSSEHQLLDSIQALNTYHILPRRYFMPSLNTLDYVAQQACPVSERVAKCILCLPLYHTLSKEEQDLVCQILLKVQNNAL
ncbi:MAG: DegT/DnrJ/EryC1/StrS family aminotransferase [Flavobacteriaceae bacterium]